MSQTFVVLGDTDHWSPDSGLKNVDMGIDSRLRRVRRDYNVSAWRSTMADKTQDAQAGKFYAELLIVASNADLTGNVFGVVRVGNESSIVTNFCGSATGGAAYRGSGQIYLNSVLVQTGLATSTVGATIGLAIYRVAGVLTCQFYRNGVAVGTAVTLTEGSYRLVNSNYYSATQYWLSVDGDDLAYRPADAQPWGAAARVSDCGGYSPAATLLTSSAGNVSIDAYGRVATAVTPGLGTAVTSYRVPGTALLYAEFLVEVVAPAEQTRAGFTTTADPLTDVLGGSGGSTGWGWRKDGRMTTGGVQSGATVTYTTGDRLGFFFDPVTASMWRSKNGVLAEGDPEAGTGAVFTAMAGSIVPAGSPHTDGRLRLATHAREQVYRPVYATAWDGADILPEQHYSERLLPGTEITFGVWFPFPWGGSRRSGSPVGAIQLSNTDGNYDKLRTYDLRDQEAVLYEMVDDVPAYLARVRIDALSFENESSLSVATRGMDSLLDVRIDEQALLLGQCHGFVPSIPIPGTDLIWDVTHTPYFFGNLYDQGVPITLGTGYFHAQPVTAQGFRRPVSVGVNGKQAMQEISTFRQTTQISLTNSSFTAWTGDNPDGWTVTEAGPAALITQNGNACRFVRTGGASTLKIAQAISVSPVFGSAVFIRLNIGTYVSGDLMIGVDGFSGPLAGITGTGVWIVPIDAAGPPTSVDIFASGAVTDISVDDVEIWQATEISFRDSMYTYLMEEYAGMLSSQYDMGEQPSNYTLSFTECGYWSDKRPTVRAIIDAVNETWLSDYYTTPEGVLKFVALYEPTDASITLAGTLEELHGRGPLSIRDDSAPALTDSFIYDFNFSPYSDSELAGSVSASDRSVFTSKGAVYVGGGYHSFYSAATGAPSKVTYLDVRVDDVTAETLTLCYADRKAFFERDYDNEQVRPYNPGDYITLKADRYGLSVSGKAVFVVSKTRRLGDPVTHMTFWG